MVPFLRSPAWILLVLTAGLAGCLSQPPTTSAPRSSGPRPVLGEHRGESLIFIGEQPATLAYRPLRPADLRLRSTYEVGPTTIQYQPGRDYLIDPAQGTLRRTADSCIPDFRTNILFGADDFDHSKFPGFGNHGFFAYADYSFQRDTEWPRQTIPPAQRTALQNTLKKLAAGQPLKLVAYGDSITAGGDATRPELIYWQRWAESLATQGSRVEAIGGATGGDRTVEGLARLQTKVLDQRPDLVLVAFGMNDHNRGGVAVGQFKTNLHEMIRRIRTGVNAEIILLSAFPPNPRWHFGQGRMAEYAAATEEVATEAGVAFADVFNNWQSLSARKKCEDLLGNNINHPNDFGHWIYYQALVHLMEGVRNPPTPR